MNEAPGTEKAADSGSGSAAPLTLNNGAAFLDPGVGGGVALNGTSDYLDFGGSGLSFAATDGFTFAAWVRHDAFQNSGNILFLLDGYSNEIQLGNSGTTRRAHVYISTRLTGGSPSNTPFTTPDGSTALFFPPAGLWAHVAWTVTTSGTFVLYRDGTTRDVWQKSGGIAANPALRASSDAALGRRAAGAGSEYFHGALRDARLYNYALSAEQIADLHASTAPPV